MSLLDMKEISKSFGGLTALNGVDLALEPGRIVGLIGPNGAGKTTLFNIITGVYRPEKGGSIQFKGRNIEGLKPHAIGELGIARTFQTPKPFRSRTVLENVMVGSFLRTPRFEAAREEAFQILQFVGMDRKEDQVPLNLTLADQKRLEIARGLATRPDLLLLDEAVCGLNLSETEDMIALLRKIRERGTTLFIIEHVMQVIMNLSDWIVILHHGTKIAEGIPEKVAADETVIKAYLGEEYAFS
jgi:branched-chain amino acid transport system ATP-binding protein